MASSAIHGGAFWSCVDYDLNRIQSVVAADVLDAWYPPSPGVVRALRHDLALACRTSPPADNQPLVQAILVARGVAEECIVVAAGSSALIFVGLQALVRPGDSALLLDPTYGEYEHVLRNLASADVRRFALDPSRGFRADPTELEASALPNDHLFLVNPNSPTGQAIPKAKLEPMFDALGGSTSTWIDETYIEYSGPDQSLERYAAASPKVVVAKSMSKVYALSGLRVAYAVCEPELAASFRKRTPPWAVSLPAQIAAIAALQDGHYYSQRIAETHCLRASLAEGLRAFDEFEVFEGCINCVLLRIRPDGPTASQLVSACQTRGVFLRDARSMGTTMGDRTVRIAVRDQDANLRIVRTIGDCLQGARPCPAIR